MLVSTLGSAARGGRLRRLLAPAVLALVLGLTLAGTGATHAQADSPPNGITVGGQGTAEVPPDLAHVAGNVQTQAATADDALNQNSQILQAVLSAVKATGVADADISTTRVTVYPIFQNRSSNSSQDSPPTIVGYRASNGIDVKITDLTKVGNLIQTMVTAGINDFSGVTYGLQNPEQLRIKALQAAIADAQQQAQASAASLGVKLGGVLNFTTQYTSAPPVPFARAALSAAAVPAPAPPPVMPGPLSANTSVTVTFAILGP